MTGAAGSDTGAAGPDTGTAGKDTDAKSPATAAGGGGSFGRIGYLLPVLVFVIVGIGLGIGLTRDPSTLPSALIDKPVPEFELPAVVAADFDKPGLSSGDLTGKVQLVNVFASWCGPCRVEHPHLMDLAAEGIPVLGINYKDAPENAEEFLSELGDPYDRIGVDPNGRAGIEFGLYGVPETFVINAEGKIVYKQVGPVTQRELPKLRAAIEAASNP